VNVISRGIRNAFRNSIRTFSIVVILGLSIGLALAMLVARAAVENKITTVKESIGNTISIAPAGARGFQGGGEPLKADQLNTIASLSNVTNVTQSLSDRLTSENTNLASAIDAGSLGNRGAGNSGVGFVAPTNPNRTRTDENGQPITRTFTPPVIVTGVNNTSNASVYGGDSVNFVSGQAFDASKDDTVAVVGKALADKNSLTTGSTFTAYGNTVKVVGVFDTGNTFANDGLVMPLATLQRLSSQAGAVTDATVTVSSIDVITGVVSKIKDTLGSSADVTSSQDSAKQAIDPLESVKSISTFSLIGAVVAGAVIILLTMIMIVRERRREIGVFKAIGASNLKIMFQFMSEAVTLTVLGLLAGLIIGAVAANPVTKLLVNNSTSNQTANNNVTVNDGAGGARGRAGGRGGFAFRRLGNFGNNTLANARDVHASVGTNVLVYGVGTAFIIAIVGSAIPALLISKIRPAEVMRAE